MALRITDTVVVNFFFWKKASLRLIRAVSRRDCSQSWSPTHLWKLESLEDFSDGDTFTIDELLAQHLDSRQSVSPDKAAATDLLKKEDYSGSSTEAGTTIPPTTLETSPDASSGISASTKTTYGGVSFTAHP